jgi:hypothetical protein
MAVPLKHKHPHVCGIQVRGGKLSARDGIASIQLKSRSACPQDMLLVLELGAAAPLQAVIQELEIDTCSVTQVYLNACSLAPAAFLPLQAQAQQAELGAQSAVHALLPTTRVMVLGGCTVDSSQGGTFDSVTRQLLAACPRLEAASVLAADLPGQGLQACLLEQTCIYIWSAQRAS